MTFTKLKKEAKTSTRRKAWHDINLRSGAQLCQKLRRKLCKLNPFFIVHIVQINNGFRDQAVQAHLQKLHLFWFLWSHQHTHSENKREKRRKRSKRLTFGRGVVSIVAGAISVSRIKRLSWATGLFFVGVELFLFFRAGDGVPFRESIGFFFFKSHQNAERTQKETRIENKIKD